MWFDAATEVATGLRPVPSGLAYQVNCGPGNAPVTNELGSELSRVLELFGRGSGFTKVRPVKIDFGKGTLGHHRVGRATDIYGVEGIGLGKWKAQWDARPDGHSNLGWRLYKALQAYGHWAQPYGYPIQLFGPWTREEGPWKFISDGLLAAHHDHIHVAK